MENFIDRLKERLQQSQYKGEQAIREALVLPILQHLDWDTTDPAMVIREFSLGSRRVDYALSANSNRKMDVFIEVKAMGEASGADRQLFEYAFHEGIPFAVLTDGKEWSFFLPGEQGTYDDRRVEKLDLLERPAKDCVAILKRYLNYYGTKSGEALQLARDDYKNGARRKLAATEIQNAWRTLVDEPDELLIDLIAEKTETLCGVRPTAEDVEAFLLSRLVSFGPVEGSKPTRPVTPLPPRSPSPSPSSERKVEYRVLGQTKKADNATEAIIDILCVLAKRNTNFLQSLSEQVKGRSRNHIARSREAVYPAKPELVGYTTEICDGWWLGTNIANREKVRIIRKACEVEGLTFGSDVQINLPNAE